MIRMSSTQMFNTNLFNMMQSQGRVNQTNNQLGTGKKVATPADDPVAAAQTLNTKTRMSVVQQYNRNIDFADKNLSQTESVLDQTETSLIRLKEIAIQLGSDQWNEQQIRSTGTEAKEILKHLQGLLNTKNESNEYIFAGSQADQKAYDGNAFQGDRIEREAQVADDTFIKMLTSGARAFEGLEGLQMVDANGDKVDWNDAAAVGNNDVPAGDMGNMLGAIQYLVNATGNGNPPSDVDKDAIRASIDNIDIAFDKVSQTRSQIGSRQNTLDAVKDGNKDFELFAKKSISDLEDLDYAEAATRFQTQMMSLQASQQAFGRISNLSLFNYI
ncbi:flagellar hook-associated protein 3 FlgL [Marinospirillum celere]|uniref:Flagellar hook-associated protein 3 FlgL n=1 Tax=Marinospirillum celere TaxID=1122252 RepID=A0A1I1HAG8_9GAMM|nr:flagellar hook-associated protein FlgL [Marinospirillum celere]SFC20715.1 flagellar hook-associated protein 3 FlgL [Marinospirillum celere]